MSPFMRKSSVVWFVSILFVSAIANFIGAYVSGNSVAGSAVFGLLLLLIPFIIELFRGIDPIIYYRLDFNSLKQINLKLITAWALGCFIAIALVDYFVFDLFNIILNSERISVGSISAILAKSPLFFLVIIVAFAGTLLEELWFRGVIQHKLSSVSFLRSVNPHFAILFQSILFGLVHFLPIYYATDFRLLLKIWFFLYPFAIAVVIGYLNNAYRSLWPGWIIHYTNNVLGVFLMVVLLQYH